MPLLAELHVFDASVWEASRLAAPSASAVWAAFAQLDGERFTTLSVTVRDRLSLGIEGGPSGYRVSFHSGDLHQVLEAQGASPQEQVQIAAGDGPVPASEVVSEAVARAALEHFMLYGALHPDLPRWTVS